MAEQPASAVPAVVLLAASPDQVSSETPISGIAEVLDPSSSSNNALPSPGPNVRKHDDDGKPSLAVRRLQARQESSKPSQMTLPPQGNCATPTAEIPSEALAGDDLPRRKSRWGSREIGHLGLSYVPASPFRIDLERPRSSIRETFEWSQTHLHQMGEKIEEKLAWNERVRHFTWNFFSMTMATGGIANVLYNVPFRFQGLDVIGDIFFIFNLLLFVMNCTIISMRFIKYPETLKASVTHPTESLFVPAAVVSLGTVILNIGQYGLGHTGIWLDRALFALFWLYAGLAIVASISVYLIIWSTQTFTIAQMTPIWIFPAYPLLLVGPIAGFLSQNIDSHLSLHMIMVLGGLTCQGVGFLISLTMYSAFIYRLMTQKLPQEAIRPGMFVSVGPSGFTCDAVVSLSIAAATALPVDFMGNQEFAVVVVRVLGSCIALCVWGLAFWFFFVSVAAHWSSIGNGSLEFAMTWFSFVFPNTALITATFSIGEAFDSDVVRWVGCIMSVLIVALWIFVFGAMIRAIYLKQILWPQKQEDRDEGGFKSPPPRKTRFGEKTPVAISEFARTRLRNPFAKDKNSNMV